MKFRHTRIESLAWVKPPVELTSAEIERRLEPVYRRLRLPEGRLELMTGIGARHFWEGPVLPSWAAAQAGSKVLERSGIDAGEIDLLIHCGVCRDRLEPATASSVHRLLGLGQGTQILDVSNACLGFLNAMLLAAGLIESRQLRSALLVTGEDGLPLLERTLRVMAEPTQTRQSIKPLFANLTIGAGAAAAVLCHEDAAPTAPRLLGAVVETDTSHNELCQGATAGDGLEMLTDSEALLDAGLAVTGRAWTRFCDELAWTAATPSRVVCHQVGRAHQRRLLGDLGIPEERDFPTYHFMGNTGSAAVPITLAAAAEAGALGPGDSVALLGIGSGLSSVMMGVQW